MDTKDSVPGTELIPAGTEVGRNGISHAEKYRPRGRNEFRPGHRRDGIRFRMSRNIVPEDGIYSGRDGIKYRPRGRNTITSLTIILVTYCNLEDIVLDFGRDGMKYRPRGRNEFRPGRNRFRPRTEAGRNDILHA